MSTFECVTVSRISRFDHRTFFSIASLIIRLAIVPLNNKTQLVFQLVLLGLKIYLDIDRERHDKNLFRSYYNSKEQLVKFKDLVVHEIPQGIAILDRDLTQFLFMNNTLQDLFTRERSGTDIQAALQRFKLHQSSDPSVSPATRTPKQTLLNLIQQSFMTVGQLQTSKISCILNYQTIGDSSQDLQENAQLIFEASLMTIVWDDQPSIAIILRDITEQHTIMSLKIADAQKDNVLATVSHELRTPLNGMLGMIQIMEKKIREPELLQYLEVCKNSGSLLVSLVNSILDVNQIRANKLKLIPEKIDLYQLLSGVKVLFDFQCKKKGIFLTVKISQISTVVTDKNRLSQILINLIGNAIKFTSKGGITIMACLSRENSDYVKFSVEDTGVGIKDADKGKLFKVFGRLDNDDERINCQGVGLGLNISDNLARVLCQEEKFKGIRVDSQYGVGTTFYFLINRRMMIVKGGVKAEEEKDDSELPQACTMLDTEGDISEKLNFYRLVVRGNSGLFEKSKGNINDTVVVHSSKTNSFIGSQWNYPSEVLGSERSKPCIMLVDDNPFNIAVAEHMITSLGFQVKSALSGDGAIDLFTNNDHRAEPIKLILMDCQMPLMDGFETTKILKRKMISYNHPETPIVALTANDSENDREKCKKVGMCDYLTKPLNEMKLQKIIKKYCK